MSLAALGVDVYQLTTLAAHLALGRRNHDVAMAFFFRKMPRQRNFVVFAGLRQILAWCQDLSFDDADLEVVRRNASIGPLAERTPDLVDALAAIRGFSGEIEALPEGTLAFAGPGRTTSGELLEVGGVPLSLYTPLLQTHTAMTLCKLIETPWLSRINHMSMVASKAARVVLAAAGRPVLEFGQRRTHPDAAVDAAYAAYLAGCAATSNLAAEARYGVPAVGTMDHFAIQASERPDTAPSVTEREVFAAMIEMMPRDNTLLVDTYDTEAGLRAAAEVGGARLNAVRLDSNVTAASVRRAREILDAHGAPQARIVVSDGLDEWRVSELAAAGAGGFGVGENITCSPDAATGVGAVAKVVVNGYGKTTMKLSRGSGKATLPGWLQVHRAADHDLVSLHDEAGPAGTSPLLVPVWEGSRASSSLPDLASARRHVGQQIEELPAHLRGLATDHGNPWPLVASDRLVDLVRRLCKEAGA